MNTIMTAQSSEVSIDIAKEKQQTSDHPHHNLATDNEVDGARSKSPVDVHKPLPPVPLLASTVFRTSPSVSTNVPSSVYSQETTNRPSTATSTSSGRSRSSSKAEFKVITRGLVNPGMAGRYRALPPVEPDMYLHPSKYDPGNPFNAPRTPPSSSSTRNANRYMNEPQSPVFPPPPLFPSKHRDPAKSDSARGVPQSHSEPTLHSVDGQHETKNADYHIPKHLLQHSPDKTQVSPSSGGASGSRGRPVQRPSSPAKKLQDVNEDEVLEVQKVSRKRSRSPVKRLLGLGKSSSLKDIAGEPQVQAMDHELEKTRRTGLKVWGDKFRHGFLTSESKPIIAASPKDVQTTPPARQSTFTISLEQPYQAKVYSEMELMLCVSANRFLVRQHAAGRVSAESIAKISSYWARKNRPQVVEFQYDQATQRDLVLYNLTALKFHGESAESALVLNATMYSWKTMAKEMGVRTFCAPDSQIRKHLHDAHKILEMLGAPLVTFLAFQELQLKTLAKISEGVKRKDEEEKQEKQKRRLERRQEIEHGVGEGGHARKASQASQASSGKESSGARTEQHQHVRKMSKEESEKDLKDVTENSRGGRLGLMVSRGDRYA